MKRKVIYTLSVCVLGLLILACSENSIDENTESIYVDIPDARFEEKLIEKGIDSDGTINQKILRSDVINVEKLNLNNSSAKVIANLKGIEAFTALKRLYVAGNKLTSVDLSTNVLLDTINLSVNELTSIKGLSVAKNLKWLSLSYNYFTEFSIDNASVKNILMSDNDLVSFNVDKAPNLETALLTLNKIEALDFSKNPLLEVLIFSSNKLKTINLENNQKLKYIYCSSNLLTDFDVSNLNKLVDLRIDRNPDLNCIKIATGQTILTVNLSSYQQLSTNCN